MSQRGQTTPDAARRPRLLVLASTYPRWSGDPEPGFVHELTKRLADCFEVTVLCPHAAGAKNREHFEGVNVVRYRYAPAALEVLVNDGGILTNLRRRWAWLLVPGFVLAQAWCLWRLIREWRPDVIHAHWMIPQGALVAMLGVVMRRMPPFLVTSHGADLFALRTWPLPALKRWVARRAAAVTVVSQGMADELQRLGADPDKITVQPMGVDLRGRFTPDSVVLRSSSEILFVGRLVEKKGLRYLIDAVPRILQSHPMAHLTVAGFGPELSTLQAQAEALGLCDRIAFMGAVAQSELPDLYRRAAVFVAPFVQAASGDQEGLGLVTVEAVGCGCPVIVTDLPATADIIEDPALRVPPADCDALASAVIAVLSASPANRHKQAAAVRDSFLSRFDWSGVQAHYREKLLRLAETLKDATCRCVE